MCCLSQKVENLDSSAFDASFDSNSTSISVLCKGFNTYTKDNHYEVFKKSRVANPLVRFFQRNDYFFD